MDAATPSVVLSGNLEEVMTFLKTNAKRARLVGNICVVATLLIGGSILVLFLYFSEAATKLSNERDIDIVKLQNDQRGRNYDMLKVVIEEQLVAMRNKPDAASADFMRQFTELASSLKEGMNAPLVESRSVADQVISNIAGGIVRIGAVLIGIFLIQILVAFARYYYKLAEHLSMTVALIGLTHGKVAELKVMAPLLLPSNIDFGKAPTSPTEKVFDGAFGVMRDLAKKIPSH